MAIGDKLWLVGKPAGTDLISDIDGYQADNNYALERLLSNYVRGCGLTFSSTTEVKIAAGEVSCTNGTTYKLRANTSTATVDCSGLDASSWYNIYAVADTAAATFTGEAAKVGTAASGTHTRRVGSIRLNGSSEVLDFIQTGKGYDRWTFWDSYQNVFDGTATNTAWTDVDCSAAVPPTSVMAQVQAAMTTSDTGVYMFTRGNGQTETGGGLIETTHDIIATYSQSGAGKFWQVLDTSQIFEYYGVQLGNFEVNVVGYMDVI